MNKPPDHRSFSPSTQRNKGPVADVLKPLLSAQARVLEFASGTGEHAVHLCQELDIARWWPSDPDPASLSSVNAWRQHSAIGAIQPPLRLDVTQPLEHLVPLMTQAGVPVGDLDCVVCINMIHISPWQACEGLMSSAQALLRPQGLLYLYGPYRQKGEHTAPSNATFDQQLKSRNPLWGVRDLESVCDLAQQHQLNLLQVTSMPANNLSVVFRAS